MPPSGRDTASSQSHSAAACAEVAGASPRGPRTRGARLRAGSPGSGDRARGPSHIRRRVAIAPEGGECGQASPSPVRSSKRRRSSTRAWVAMKSAAAERSMLMRMSLRLQGLGRARRPAQSPQPERAGNQRHVRLRDGRRQPDSDSHRTNVQHSATRCLERIGLPFAASEVRTPRAARSERSRSA